VKKARFETQNYHRVTEMVNTLARPYNAPGSRNRYDAGFVIGGAGMGKSAIAAQIEQAAVDLGYETIIIPCSNTHRASSFLQDTLNALKGVRNPVEDGARTTSSSRLIRMIAQHVTGGDFYTPGMAKRVIWFDEIQRIWYGDRNIFKLIAEIIDIKACPVVLSGWPEVLTGLLRDYQQCDYRWRIRASCAIQPLGDEDFQRLFDQLGELIYPPLVRGAIWKAVGEKKNSISDILWLVENLDRMKYSRIKEVTVEHVQQVWQSRKERM